MAEPAELLLSAYDFELPPEQIAQEPPARRHDARLMVLDRATGATEATEFPALLAELREGDVVVRNVARVAPVRLLGTREDTGGKVEALLLGRDADGPGEHRALLRPGRRMREGIRLVFGSVGFEVRGRVDAPGGEGLAVFRVAGPTGEALDTLLDAVGEPPLPPYIRAERPDPARYQTTYASVAGSAAAPTAGFHFEAGDFEDLRGRGVEVIDVLLHVGLGTFAPVKVEDLREHRMHREEFEVTPEAAARLAAARAEGRRVVAVGTTTVRVLESLADHPGWEGGLRGGTDLFLRPGHEFTMVDALVTNFHLPRSTLLVLVSAFAGREPVLAAYRRAVAEGFRFFSFGDAMWIR